MLACLALAIVGLAASVPAASALNFSASQNADLQLGAPAGGWTTRTLHSAANMAYGMWRPNGVAVDGSGSVYVADSGANRVMRWAATPAADGTAMSNVVMKADSSQASWFIACSNGADGPEQISVVGDGATTRMAIVDRFNHRIVLFATEPTTDGATGTVFLGQASGASCGPDRGGSAAANTLDSPSAVWTDGTRVAVADTSNNRVLLWDSWPTTGQAADRVLGQADFTSTSSNRGGASPAANTLSGPKGVTYDGTWLYVSDSANDRVLAFSGWPATNGVAASRVIGQPDFVSNGGTCSNRRLNYPTAIATTGSGAGHQLAISSEYQDRVVVLTAWPTTAVSDPIFSSVLGQANFTSCSPNRSAATSTADSIRSPSGLNFDTGGNLWVVDSDNNRVLRFPSVATGTAANRVLGHGDFVTNVAYDSVDDNVFPMYAGASSATPLGARITMAPSGIVAVSDPNDASVRLWTSAPAADNAAYTFRIGQTARTRGGNDGPGSNASATTFDEPTGVWTDGTRLLVADRTNNRVLAWLAMPTSDADDPDYVLGQATMTATSPNSSQTRMDAPTDVTSDGVDVFVADRSNDRVLIFRNFWLTPANGKAADVVLGQANFTANNGATGQTRLQDPYGVSVDARRRLAVADNGNHRVMLWNDHATVTNGQAADAVIGQPNFTANAAGGVAEDTNDVEFAGGGLLWTEDCSIRYLDPVPDTGATTSSSQVGVGCAGQTPGQNRIDSPSGVTAGGGRIWAANTEHGRMMRWTDATTPTLTAGPTATVRCDGTVTISWTTSESTTTEIRWDTVSRASWAGGYANQSIDTAFTGLTHSYELNFPTPGTRYVRVRAEDWNAQSVVSGEISFTVPATCPAPTTMLADDANAQTGRANPSTTNAPPIRSTTFRTAWQNVSGVTMDRVDAQAWTTPPEHAGGMWHLDGSTAADANSQTSNAVTWTGAQPYTTGRFGQAATFTADGQYGTIANDAAITRSNGFTFDLWFQTTSIANDPFPIMAIKSDGGCGAGYRCNYALEWDRAANNICGVIVNTSNTEVQACRTASGLLDGQWHHALMTVSATNAVRLYVDGVLAGGPTASAAPPRTGADPLTIGRAGINVEHFRGSVDEVRFSPVVYDDAAVLGYYRTRRAHLQQLWNQGSTALGATCATATRCEDQAYAGIPDFLRDGARYWMRTRFNTLTNDYWTDRGVDWFETSTTETLNITVGGSVAFGTTLPGADAFGSSTVQVTTNAAAGYSLLARDESDSWGLERTGGGAQPTVPDLQDGSIAPALWPAGTSGFYGMTVRSATGNRLAKWGTAPGGFAENDTTNNRYTGLEGTSDVLLHERTTYGTGTDTIVLTWRSNPGASQAPGTYDGVMYLSAIANP